MTTRTIIEFLRARLHEDEQAARETLGRQPLDQWDAVGATGEDDPSLSYWRVTRIAHADPTPAARSIARHIARWDPARVLAEVEAKRRIISRCERLLEERTASSELDWAADFLAHDVLRDLAAPHASHPDYSPTWAPADEPAP